MASNSWQHPFRRSLRHGKRATRVSVRVDIATRPFGWIDRWGLVIAQVFGWAALGPSLIPRRWWMTAVAIGLSQISGYMTGRSLHLAVRAAWFVLRRLIAGRGAGPSTRPSAVRLGGDGARLSASERARARRTTRARTRPWAVRGRATSPLAGAVLLHIGRMLERDDVRAASAAVVGGLAGAGTVASLRTSVTRQSEIARLVRARMPARREQLAGMAAGTGIAAGALGLEWLRLIAARGVRSRLRSVAPGAVALVAGVALPAAVLTVAGDRAVRRIWSRMVATATANNDLDIPGVTRPTTPLRSGSPASPVAWSALGRHGRAFAGSGASATDIASATGRDAIEPIRAFTSVASWRSIAGAARAATSELRRTGAYDRDVLVIATTTGTGWLSDWSVGAVEHLTGGNCATVAVQYTLLPSGLAVLGHPRGPIIAARALLDAVERDLSPRPPQQRPRVFVTGESLGAFGVLGAESSIDELLARIDGGVLAGAPRVSRHWDALVASRDEGSPEVTPVIDGGRRIRFATRPAELDADAAGTPLGTWQAPRLAMLQHASDPIVWWSPRLLTRRPAWMRERAGRDVTTRMQWMSAVTFWQVTTDMPAAVDTPGGVAHRYFEEYVPAWDAVLGTGLDDATLARVTESIRASLPQR
ncbi:alpha/beta-hydrolase family protein [Pseudoclavibacter endophyticus]|nr:alpha/beta-hydrolase family protein [Pseudoclavibacter endophyticus]